MDQIRNFAQSNRSSIVSLIYLVAAFVLVYYLVMYYMDGDDQDLDVLRTKLASNQITKDNMSYKIADKDETKYRAKSEYTLSFWLYLNGLGGEQAIPLLALIDAPASKKTLLTFAMHPSKPQMFIRAGKIKGAKLNSDDPMTTFTQTETNYKWDGFSDPVDDGSLKSCDVMDIDLQRWMCITVSVNGRIMDVYLDGKLARSCILENVQDISSNDQQLVLLMPGGAFRGFISGIRWSNYAVTPDVIYGRYQAGPYFSQSFLDYLVDKLGIRIAYTGTAGTTNVFNLLPTTGN